MAATYYSFSTASVIDGADQLLCFDSATKTLVGITVGSGLSLSGGVLDISGGGFFVLGGQSGGQTAYGGTGVGQNLDLRGSSGGGGNVIFFGISGFNSSGKLMIGTTGSTNHGIDIQYSLGNFGAGLAVCNTHTGTSKISTLVVGSNTGLSEGYGYINAYPTNYTTAALQKAFEIQGGSTISKMMLKTTSTAPMTFEINSVEKGRWTTGGLSVGHTATASAPVHISNAGGSSTGLRIDSTSSSQYAVTDWFNSSGDQAQMLVCGSGFNSGIFIARSASFNNSGSGGISIVSYHASGFINFAAGGSATTDEKMRVTPTGLKIGSTAAPTRILHQDQGNATATYHKFTAGTTTGTTATSGFDVGIDSAGNAEVRQYSNRPISFFTNNASVVNINGSGRTFFGGSTNATAVVHLAAGTATASTAPLKFTSGTSLTTAEAGCMEFTTDDLFFTITTGAARKNVTLWDTLGTSGRVPYATTNGRLKDDASLIYDTTSGLQTTKDIRMTTAGAGLYVKEGTNATMGVATLVAGTVTVNTTKVTTNSRIFLTVESLGTVTVATPIAVTARTAGTSFTITSSNVVDTSVVSWLIVEPS